MAKKHDHEWFEKTVAITTAILSVFLALSSILGTKAGGDSTSYLIQANDQWAFFQAKSIKGNIYEANRYLLLEDASNPNNPKSYNDSLNSTIATFDSNIARYSKEKADIQATAQNYTDISGRLGAKSDVYNYSQGFYQIALILAAIALLAKKRYMWILSCALGLIGIGFTIYAFMMP